MSRGRGPCCPSLGTCLWPDQPGHGEKCAGVEDPVVRLAAAPLPKRQVGDDNVHAGVAQARHQGVPLEAVHYAALGQGHLGRQVTDVVRRAFHRLLVNFRT